MKSTTLRYLLSLAALSPTLLAQAQDTTTVNKQFRNGIGVEVTGLIPMSQGEFGGAAIYPYFLTYRRALGPGWVRFGVGASGWSDHANGDANSSVIIRESSSWRTSARLGYALPLVDERRWLVLAGLDALHTSYNFESRYLWEDNSESITQHSTLGIGLGLAIDAQFRIGKRMALGTEFNLELMRSKSTEDRTYSDEPEHDEHATSESTSLDAIRAFSLFLHAYF